MQGIFKTILCVCVNPSHIFHSLQIFRSLSAIAQGTAEAEETKTSSTILI